MKPNKEKFMKIHFLNIFLVTVTLVSFCTMSNADNLSGTGDNLGGGWRSDGNGGYRGSGDNLGSGWRSDGNGGLRGTGDNLGRGYRKR